MERKSEFIRILFTFVVKIIYDELFRLRDFDGKIAFRIQKTLQNETSNFKIKMVILKEGNTQINYPFLWN